MTLSIQFRYGKHVDMDNRKNVLCGCTGKILKTHYLDYLDFKEYNSTSVQCRTCRWTDTEAETHFGCGAIWDYCYHQNL
jgi:hypothetical protein